MNVLEQLASDMADVGREARISGEDETDACLAVVHEFNAEHEVVEVFDVRHTGEPADHWLAMPDSTQHEPDFVWGDKEVVTPLTIIVPRKQEPTLLEAAEGVLAQAGEFGTRGQALADAFDVLGAAIKREERNG